MRVTVCLDVNDHIMRLTITWKVNIVHGILLVVSMK